jgi:hypothetical protein
MNNRWTPCAAALIATFLACGAVVIFSLLSMKEFRSHEVALFHLPVGAVEKEDATFSALGDIATVDAIIFVVVWAISCWTFYEWKVRALEADHRSTWERFFDSAVPIFAALFFVYQALSGSFFATTSPTLEVKVEKEQPEKALVTASLERGDNWLVEVASAQYIIGPAGQDDSGWRNLPLPRRSDGHLRLGPKEKTTTQIRVDLAEKDDWFITTRFVTYALYWPVPSVSYARALIPMKACASTIRHDDAPSANLGPPPCSAILAHEWEQARTGVRTGSPVENRARTSPADKRHVPSNR